MIQIGRFRFGFAVASTIVVFVVLTVCAIVAALNQSRSESPMPLSALLIINEGMALLATLIYGIFAHFILAIIEKFRKR